ncbi:MAG: DUF1285 domain-containing protein [Candidatus Rokubacteria bacterium]|nr:DUF1285 domain-containing protein [Candidatus Rokubacteria bacterium]
MAIPPPEQYPGEGSEGPPLRSEWRLPRLRVDRDAVWYDDDIEVTHPGVLANLRGNLRRDAGGYFIQTRVRIPVEVEDVPWVVTRLERRGDRLHAVVNDGTEEDIDPATLRIGPDDVPYCAVKGGAFQARLNRAAAFQLLALEEQGAVRPRRAS